MKILRKSVVTTKIRTILNTLNIGFWILISMNLIPVSINAEDITYFDVDATIYGGYYYDASVQNNAILTIEGGSMTFLRGFDNSTINMLNADILHAITPWGNSVCNLYGGNIHELSPADTSTTNIYGGVIGVHIFAQRDSVVNIYNVTMDSTANPSDGTIGIYGMGNSVINIFNAKTITNREGITANETSIINIYGGQFPFLNASSSGIINIYGYELNLTQDEVSGRWSSSIPFNISVSSSAYGHIILNEIPEPASLLLLSLGSILFIRKKQSKI